MEDYPRNLKEFDVRFRSEEACREYLLQLRWPDGFRCPRCGCRESLPVRAVLLRCRDCRHQTSVTAGTIFQDTRTSLRLWFQAIWWVVSQKNRRITEPLHHNAAIYLQCVQCVQWEVVYFQYGEVGDERACKK
jgi:hypothetical protein